MFGSISISSAQSLEEKEQNLISQHENILNVSTTYQDYKVIKISKMDEFWKSIQDYISTSKSSDNNYQTKISSLQKQLNKSNTELSNTKSLLEESNNKSDNMKLLGMLLSKKSYKSVFWIITVVLAALLIVFFLKYNRNNSVTKETNKEFNNLNEEFDMYKKNSREKELSLKRELQTAINTIDELKI